jgi:hypothetical protein
MTHVPALLTPLEVDEVLALDRLVDLDVRARGVATP